MRLDYGKEKMQEVEVRGIRCEFNDMRIDRNTVPEGKFQYEVAGDDDSGGDPARIQKGVMVNFYGTLISDEELPLGEQGILWVEDGDFRYLQQKEVLYLLELRIDDLKCLLERNMDVIAEEVKKGREI